MTGEALTLPFETPPDPAAALVGHGLPARNQLWAIVRELQGADPLAPVTVAVPSPYAGLSLRRELGAATGLLNVRFMALGRVAELLGAPALAASGRRPLTRPLRVEAVAAALGADPGPFVEVREHPSTARGIAASLADLRTAGIAPDRARGELNGRGPRAAAVARLYADVTERTSDYYDEHDVLLAATEAVGRAHADDLGHVVVWMPTALSPAEAGFVGALALAGRATVVLGLTGDGAVDGGLTRPLAQRLGIDPEVPPPDLPLGTELLAAPDPEDEVRAVVRRIVAHADAGTALHEMAVLYRLDDPYARLVPELLDAAAIAWNGPSPRRLADAVVARVLLGALSLADADLARDEVAAWLASGPILDPDGRRVPATRWDVVSREAGVVGGAEQWADRLRRHRDQLAHELAAARVDADTAEWRVARLEGDVETTDRLAAFVADLAEQLVAPADTTWAAHVAWAASLVERSLGGEGKRFSWPDGEIDAARRVAAALEGLAALDALGTPVELGRFRRALADELDVPFGRVESFGTGVFVGALHHAYGARFEAIFVLGMAEGSFPPRGREDPLLPDAERRAIGGLPSHAERRLAERRDYLAALVAAPERVLCFPRADPRAQRRRLPSRWLLETARHLHGGDLTAEALRDLPGADWLHVVQSFADGVTADADPGSVTERDVRALAEWAETARPVLEHPLAVDALGRGFAAIADRASPVVTRHDGLVGAALSPAPGVDHPVSPTALQDWATCPLQYLLARVLRVREVPKPEATEAISALDEGTLVHAILEDFLRRARPRSEPGEAWTEADAALMGHVVDEHCDDAERRGITGRPLQWVLARRRIRRSAFLFLYADAVVRRSSGTLPAADGLEWGFGADGEPAATIVLADGREVAFRGRVDRVDRSPDGTRVDVYDYKTGRRRHEIPDDPVAGGHLLQLPVYALAAADHYGATEVQASYWHTRADPADALESFPFDDSTRARFGVVVGKIVEGIGDGCFPAYPGLRDWSPVTRRDSFENCTYCPYDRLCAPDRLAAWDRKTDDPVLQPFLTLDDDGDGA